MKKQELASMLDSLGSAVIRQRLIELIDDVHYKIATHLSQLDPMFSENVLKRLRVAVDDDNPAEVFSILDELKDFDTTLETVRRTLQDIQAVIRWGIRNGD